MAHVVHRPFVRDLLDKAHFRFCRTPQQTFQAHLSISVPYKGESDFSLIKVCYFLRMIGLGHTVSCKTTSGRKKQKVLIFFLNLTKTAALDFFSRLIFIHSRAILRRDGSYHVQLPPPRSLVFISSNLFDFNFYPKRHDFFGWKQPVFVTLSSPYPNVPFFSLYKIFPTNHRLLSKFIPSKKKP